MDQTPKVRHIVYSLSLTKVLTGRTPKNIDRIEFIPLEQFEERGKAAHIDEKILKERPVKTYLTVIMYTSGSTGTPKGFFSS